MKNKKIQFRFFTITQYNKEAEYLRRQHKKGWKITRVNFPGIYHFVKCTPEDVIYQLDYNQEGLDHEAEYVKMFEDCGWEYMFSFFGYTYFRKKAKEMLGKEEIFCDDESRLEMMRRMFKGRMIPLLGIFFCIIIPQLFLQVNLNGFLSPLFIAFVLMFILYDVIFIQFGI